MVSLEFIPLKTTDGKTVGHARVKGGVTDLTLKTPMRGQVIVLSDSGSATGSIGASIAMNGQVSAVAIHDRGTLLCYGTARDAAITTEDIRRRLLTFRAAQQERVPRETPQERREVQPDSVHNEPAPWQPTVEYLQPKRAPHDSAKVTSTPRIAPVLAEVSQLPTGKVVRDPVAAAERAILDRTGTETAEALTPKPLTAPPPPIAADPMSAEYHVTVPAQEKQATMPLTPDDSTISPDTALRDSPRFRAPSSCDRVVVAPVHALKNELQSSAAIRPPADPAEKSRAAQQPDNAASEQSPVFGHTPSPIHSASQVRPPQEAGVADGAVPQIADDKMLVQSDARPKEQDAVLRTVETLSSAEKQKGTQAENSPPVREQPSALDAADLPIQKPVHATAPDQMQTAPPSDTAFSVFSAPRAAVKPPTVADTAADAASFAALLKRADAVFSDVQREKTDAPELSTLSETLPHREVRREMQNADSAPAKPAPPPEDAKVSSSKAYWDDAVDTLLETPVSTVKTPVQNPFPHIFPGAHFVRLCAQDGSQYLEGDCMQGRERVHIVAVPGNYSPQTPAHLPGFTRFIRTRMGGFWVKVQ